MCAERAAPEVAPAREPVEERAPCPRPEEHEARRPFGDRDRARDVVQETFVELERSERRQTDSAPAKWLFTVCRNRALNICRKEKRMTYLDDQILESEQGHDPAPN